MSKANETVDVAEEIAKENATANLPLTTAEDLLVGYTKKTVSLSTGKVFEIESFVPGSLMININAPLIQEFVGETDDESAEELLNTRLGVVTEPIKQLVCDHIINVPFSMLPQWRCQNGVVSIDRLTLGEIRELFKEMCALSGAMAFPKQLILATDLYFDKLLADERTREQENPATYTH